MGRIERGRRAKRRQVGPGAGRRCSPGCPSAVALAVRLQDVDVVGEPVQQRAGQALRAEDLDERFRSGGGQGHEAQFVDDQQVQTEQIPPEVEQASFVPGLQRSALPRFHRRDCPSAVPQPVYFDNMALLDRRACRIVAESVEPARASRPPWLETALFTAPAGNSPMS